MTASRPGSLHRPVSLHLYGLATGAVSGVAPLWLRARARRGKEDPARWPERLGLTRLARPDGRLAWLHGVSVGESLSLLPLIERLTTRAPGVAILVTSGTLASAEVLASRLPPGAIHQFAPLDTPGATRRFLDHWRPDLGVLVESELWPNLILAARARGTRLALASAKLSAGSVAGWRRAPGAARAVLGAFDLILARDDVARGRLASLGARVDGLADLKFGAAPLPADPAALANARRALGDRPVLLAASTHRAEDAPILAAFAAARRDDRPLLILAPRHPARGEAVAALAAGAGLTVGRRSAGAALGEADVHVADTVGELGLWYCLARLAVIGGSLGADAAGGHNPLEPARLGCPFISGRGVDAWPVYGPLQAAGATALIDPDQLAAWFGKAIEADACLPAMADRARQVAAAGDAEAGAAIDRVLDLLVP